MSSSASTPGRLLGSSGAPSQTTLIRPWPSGPERFEPPARTRRLSLLSARVRLRTNHESDHCHHGLPLRVLLHSQRSRAARKTPWHV